MWSKLWNQGFRPRIRLKIIFFLGHKSGSSDFGGVWHYPSKNGDFGQKWQDVSFHMAYPGYLRNFFQSEKKAFAFALFWSIMDHFHRKSMGTQWSWPFELFHCFFVWFHILCDRHTSDYAHFTFSDTIWPLSLSSSGLDPALLRLKWCWF